MWKDKPNNVNSSKTKLYEDEENTNLENQDTVASKMCDGT